MDDAGPEGATRFDQSKFPLRNGFARAGETDTQSRAISRIVFRTRFDQRKFPLRNRAGETDIEYDTRGQRTFSFFPLLFRHHNDSNI